MTDSPLEEQSRAYLELHDWRFDSGKYSHSSGGKLDLTNTDRPVLTGLLSPSSLELVNGCKRRFYLNRKPESKDSRFISVYGQSAKEPFNESARALEGRILHAVMSLLVNNVLKDPGSCQKLGWKTVLAPVIHFAIASELKSIKNSANSSSVVADTEITVNRLLETVNRITADVIAKGIGGIPFEKIYWNRLTKIKMDAERPLEKDGFIGYADLVANQKGELLVVDYKTGRVPETSELRKLDSRETMKVLATPNHPLHSEAIQVACYLWLLSDENATSKAWTVHAQEDPLQVIEYQAGPDLIKALSERIREGLSKAAEILKSQNVPEGSYNAWTCNQCRFRMNCQALLHASEEADLAVVASELRRGTIPLLLRVSRIMPEEGQVELAMKNATLKVELSSNQKNYLRQVQSVLRSGIDLLGFVRLRIGSDIPFSDDIEFSRC